MDEPTESGSPLSAGLYVVATPIGNLADLSFRALEVLRSCNAIACEDKRISSRLLNRYGIENNLIPYHEHNERRQAGILADKIERGQAIALISDAGTPTVSDPGFRLVRECKRRDLPVSPIPGPSASLSALSASGLPSNAFTFVGFLPPKAAARRRFLENNRDSEQTQILFEATHRIEKLLSEVNEIMGPDRVLCVARELTKLHETILTGPAAQLEELVARGSRKGEFVVIIAPASFVL